MIADGVLNNDIDVEGDTLTVTELNGASGAIGNWTAIGSTALVKLNVDGSFDYDPNGMFESLAAGQTTTDTFTYTVDDGNSGTDTATATIIITGVNDIPTLTTFTAVVDTTNEDTEVELTFAELLAQGDEADIDGTVDAFIVKSVTTGTLKIGTSPGTATAWAAGTNDTINATLHAYWTPAADVNGTQNAFQVVAEDDDGGESASNVTVQVSVTDVNDAPVITGGPDTDGLTETNAGLTSTGTLTVSDADMTDLVTAAVDTVGVGGTGAASVPGTLTNAILRGFLTVSPTAILDATELTDTLTWDFNSGGQAFDFLATSETLILTYTASATDDDGTPLSDTETVTITGTNDVPTLTNFSAVVETTNEDTEVEISFADLTAQGNEADIDGTADAFVVKSIATGTLKIGTSAGTATAWAASTNDTIDATNHAYWTPANNSTGTQNAFAVVAEDNQGAESGTNITVQVAVTADNDPPVIGNNGIVILEGGTVVLSGTELSATDIDDPDAGLTFTVSGVTAGQFELVSTPQTAITSFTQAQITSSQVVFVHDGSESAPTYSITVSDGVDSDGPQVAAVTFTNVNDAPVITGLGGDSITIFNDGLSVVIDNGAAAVLQDSDSPVNYDGGYLRVTGSGFSVLDTLGIDTSGTISLSAGFTDGSVVSVSTLNVGTLTGTSASTVRFDFNANATATHVDALLQAITFSTTSSTLGGRSVDFVFNDGDGTANGGVDTSSTQTANIFVAQVGDGLVTTNEDTTYTFVAADFDFTGVTGSDLQTIQILRLPVEGTLNYNGSAAVIGQIVSKADIDAGLLEFVPDADENGAGYVSFDFRMNNGKPVVNVLAGEPNFYTLNGGALVTTDSILADGANFGVGGTYPSSLSVVATSSTIDAAYLAQGDVLFNGFVVDGNWTAGELAALDTWVQSGGVLISTNDLSSYDDVSSFYGLTIGGTADSTWHVADDTSAVMNGPFGLVGNNGSPISAAGAISYFSSASLAVGDQILAVDSVSGEPTMVLRQHGSGHILFTSDEGIFRTNMTGGGTIATANDILAANVFAWAADQVAPTESHTMNVDVTAINDDPVNIGGLPLDVSATEDIFSSIDLSVIDLFDVDSAGGSLTVTLSTAGGGTLSAIGTGQVNATGAGTPVLTLSGTQGDLNTFLNNTSSISFTGSLNDYGNDADSIQVDVTDNNNIGLGGGGTINPGTVNVDITAVNDAPVNTVPGQRGREVWLMKTQYLGEEVMIPCGLLLLSFDAVIFRMVLEQCDGHSS